MILSASRRTDIPAFYSQWFMNRLREGFVLVKNPRNPNRCSRVRLTPAAVDCIVFWTKNPRPLLSWLGDIEKMGYPFYFQFTLNPYDERVEPGLPPKAEIVETFKQLSEAIGSRRIVWRYDPVIVNREFTVQYHLDSYQKMADTLGGYTDRCIFSFVDRYAKSRGRAKGIVDEEVNEGDMNRIAAGFSQIAKEQGMMLSACSEKIDLSRYGVARAACIDKEMVERIIGCPIQVKKDLNQRGACGCSESVDIGSYDCCLHGCVYCYATTSRIAALNNWQRHNPQSAILIGEPNPADIVTDREAKTLKKPQLSLF
ncbi:MAG: DUF1848 domain-containing protein [Veillonellales bacterium]